jgi:hypothetical protein
MFRAVVFGDSDVLALPNMFRAVARWSFYVLALPTVLTAVECLILRCSGHLPSMGLQWPASLDVVALPDMRVQLLLDPSMYWRFRKCSMQLTHLTLEALM